MFKISKVEIVPRRDRFGVEHRLTVEGNVERLKEAFKRYGSAEHFEAEGRNIELRFGPDDIFDFELEKPLDDYYDEDINAEWKSMVMDALGTEEPFRYYSFYTSEGEHIGTVGYKRDCDSFIPVIVVYRNF